MAPRQQDNGGPRKVSNRASSGGRAEASGSNFEVRVQAWYCVLMIAEGGAQPPYDLTPDTRIISVACQAVMEVDDAVARTSADGWVFAQAKRRMNLSALATSSLASSLDQFVRQYKACQEASANAQPPRPLDHTRDRLVLALGSASSSNVKTILPNLLRSVRHGVAATLGAAARSAAETEVATAVEKCVQRSWNAAYGRGPTAEELRDILTLTYVQQFDIEAGEADERRALDLLRGVLAVPDDAPAAWAKLLELCAQMRADRSATNFNGLVLVLRQAGIALNAPPDYRADIAALKSWTGRSLGAAPRFLQLLASRPDTRLARDVWPTVRAAADQGSFLIVGDPGSGKSGLAYTLGLDRQQAAKDLVFLPVDTLKADSQPALRAALGITHDLADVLAHWPGTGDALLVVDALDAARDGETRDVLRSVIDEVLRDADGRWRVVASVRKYDLRHGLQWSQLFAGLPPAADHADRAFPHVRHVSVRPLTEAEIGQVASTYAPLHALVATAPAGLRVLLGNIFNLHLLAELLADGVVGETLREVCSQSELLDLYWKHRVIRDDDGYDAREALLLSIVERMISTRRLQISRRSLGQGPNAGLLPDLLRHGVLSAGEMDGHADEGVLLFSHNVLFDYAAARLWLDGGRDIEHLISHLKAGPELTLMLSPSLSMVLGEAWAAPDPARPRFWGLGLRMAIADGLPEVARLMAPMVAAEQARSPGDFAPLITALQEPGTKEAAERFARHLVGAALFLTSTGTPLLGPSAGPWAQLAEGLSAHLGDGLIDAVRPLLLKLTESVPALTGEDLANAGQAARRFLAYVWQRQPRHGLLVINGIQLVSRTIASDPGATAQLLRRAFDPSEIAAFGYQELRWMAHEVQHLAACDPHLVVELFDAAYSFEEQSSEKTAIGASQLLPLTSNRHQDYGMAWWALSEAFPRLITRDVSMGVRALCRAVEGFINRRYPIEDGEHRQPESFILGSGIARISPDWSHVWHASGVQHPTDAPAVVAKFQQFLTTVQNTKSAAERFREILSLIATHGHSAVLWSIMLFAGARRPELYAADLVPVVTAAPILRCLDTRHAVGDFLQSAYSHLNKNDRRRIEDAVLSLDGDDAARVQARVLACIPGEHIVSDGARQLQAELVPPQEIGRNHPPFQLITSWAPFGADDWLRDLQVPLETPVNQRLRGLEGPLERFIQDHLNVVTSADDVEALLPDLEGLFKALETAEVDGAAPALVLHAWEMLAEAAAAACRATKEAIAAANATVPLRTVLLAASDVPPPSTPNETEGLLPRAPAALGLILLVPRASAQDEAHLAALQRLIADPEPVVRHRVADNIHMLWFADPELAWSTVERVVEAETHGRVLCGALRGLSELGKEDTARAENLILQVLARVADDEGREARQARDFAIWLLGDLYIWQGRPAGQRILADLAADPANESHMIAQTLGRYGGAILAETVGNPDDQLHQVRQRALAWYALVLNGAADAFQAMLAKYPAGREIRDPDAGSLQAICSVLDASSVRLLGAVGGLVQLGTRPAQSAEQKRLVQEAKPMLQRLSALPLVPVAHHVIQTLDVYRDEEPDFVFSLIAQCIRSVDPAGYADDQIAATTVVTIVNAYLADYPEVFASPDRQRDLLDILDAFVRAGWTEARALVFRISDIWR